MEKKNSTLKKQRSCHLVPSLHGKIGGEKVETLTDFFFLGSKITVDGDGSHEIKGCLLDFPGSSVVKNVPAKAGDTGSIPDLGRSHMQLDLCHNN